MLRDCRSAGPNSSLLRAAAVDGPACASLAALTPLLRPALASFYAVAPWAGRVP